MVSGCKPGVVDAVSTTSPVVRCCSSVPVVGSSATESAGAVAAVTVADRRCVVTTTAVFGGVVSSGRIGSASSVPAVAAGAETRLGEAALSAGSPVASLDASASRFDFLRGLSPVPLAFSDEGCRADLAGRAEVPTDSIASDRDVPDGSVSAPSGSERASDSDFGVPAADVGESAARPLFRSRVPELPASPAVPPGVDGADAASESGGLPSSAQAVPGALAKATPTPKATANPPIRPTKPPAFMTAPLSDPIPYLNGSWRGCRAANSVVHY